MWEGNIQFGEEILKKVIQQGKNLFLFDDRILALIKDSLEQKKSNKIYIPHVDEKLFYEINKFSYLPNSQKPILCVIGTSNRQGKFTTQLRIKEILEARGYKVSQISTEPQGELFGADFTFPYGYGGTVKINSQFRLVFLRTLIKAIEKYNDPDIIVTGIQGGLVPRKIIGSMPDYNAVDSTLFIHGILPDIVVCAINPQDSVELIKSTIRVAKTYSKANNIFFTITPWERSFQNTDNMVLANNKFLSREELNKKIEDFSKELKTPVLDIMNKDNNTQILNLIINACQ